MASRQRPVDIGADRARILLAQAGRELREARRDRGLSLFKVGVAARLSEATVSRLERGLIAHASVWDLARLHAVVGLELSLKSYAGGQPVRDAAHVALLSEFRARLHPSLSWALEVPLPGHRDPRAWDALVRCERFRYGVEAETAPRDVQALARRLNTKERDSGVDGVILVLRLTVQTRRFLAEAGESLRTAYPVNGARALELLGVGADPGGSAIVVLPANRSSMGRPAAPLPSRT
jgi:transcriptional regulator with XRE-family HTH domain